MPTLAAVPVSVGLVVLEPARPVAVPAGHEVLRGAETRETGGRGADRRFCRRDDVGSHLKLPAGGQWVPNDGHYGVWSARREVFDDVAPGPGGRWHVVLVDAPRVL